MFLYVCSFFFVWKYSYFRYLQTIVVNKWVGYRQVNLQKMSVSIINGNEPAEMAERVEYKTEMRSFRAMKTFIRKKVGHTT